MPHAEHGFRKVLFAMVMGFMFSYIFDAMTPVAGPETALLRVGFTLMALMTGLITLRNANYWGISYTMGYFAGLMLFGNFFMEMWELYLYASIVGVYLVIKISRKTSDYI